MNYSKDALLHKLQDEIDSLFRDNIVIPIAWREDEDGETEDNLLCFKKSEIDN